MKQTYQAALISKEEIAGGIFDYCIECPPIAADAVPGQFIHIDCGEGTLLRRPISICDVQENRVRFIFEVKGKGTHDLSHAQVGDMINVMGPLGTGFLTDDTFEKPILIGGGIGIFPLFYLAKKIKQPRVFLGFRSKDRIVMGQEFQRIAATTIATDDGSYGYHGFAAAIAQEEIDANGCDAIYACGPTPMLRAVKKMAEERSIPCRLSLEQRMGCGIGACLVCTCATVHQGTEHYKRVCKDGPVFWSTEVTLDE